MPHQTTRCDMDKLRVAYPPPFRLKKYGHYLFCTHKIVLCNRAKKHKHKSELI